MDLTQYQNHECIAYKDSEFKNPLEHKSSLAVWKTPKGTLVAKGRCLTEEDIAMATKYGKEAMSSWAKIQAKFQERKKYVAIGVVLLIVVLVIIY